MVELNKYLNDEKEQTGIDLNKYTSPNQKSNNPRNRNQYDKVEEVEPVSEKPFEERNNIFNNPEYQKKSLVDKAGTITTNILNTVAGSGASLGAGVASAGDMLVDLSMQRDIQTPMEDYAEKSQQFAQEKFEAGSWNDNLNVMESLKEGNIGEAISKGVQGALQNSAQLATITTMGILTGGASNAAASGLLNSTGAITQAAMQNAPLALIGASAGGGQYASLDDREDLSINQKVTSGLTATAIESATETYGSLNWLDDIMRSTPGARSQVVDSVFDIARRSIDPKKVAINAGEEALEEITAGFSNEIANSIMGINDKSLPEVIMNYEDYLNQGIIGGFSGAGMSIGAQIANTVMTPTQQQEQSPEEIDLSNQISQQYNLPQETVDKIQSDISQIINSDPSEILQDSEMEEDNGIITTYQPDNQVDVEQTTEETQQEQTIEPIDLSNTSQNQLLTVPGIGSTLSNNIMEYINENGIESVDDLANVNGVGQATLDKIRDRFTVGETITEETTEQEVETPVEETIEDQIEEMPEEVETEQKVTEEPQQELTVDEIDDQIDDLFFELEQAETETEQYELRQEIDRLEQQRAEMIDNQEGQVDTQQEIQQNIEPINLEEGNFNQEVVNGNQVNTVSFDDGSEISVSYNEETGYTLDNIKTTSEVQQVMRERGMIYQEENGDLAYNENNIIEFVRDYQNETTETDVETAEINLEQLSEMAKEYNDPYDFLESVVTDYGYLPDLGLNEYNDFREFWADNTDIDNITSAPRTTLDEFDLSFDSELPDVSLEITDNITTEGRAENNTIKISNEVAETSNEQELKTILAHEYAHNLIDNDENVRNIVNSNPDNILGSFNQVTEQFEGVTDFGINGNESFVDLFANYLYDTENFQNNYPKQYEFMDSLFGNQQQEIKNTVDNLYNEIRPTQQGTETQALNLNSATIDDLTEIKGIGASTAQNIINYRDSKENGIESVDELKQVKGIGSATFDKIAPSFTAEQVDTTDTADTIEEPTDSDITANDDVESEVENLDADEIASEVDDVEGSITQTNELLSEEARDLMEFEDTDIREYLDVVLRTSLDDLQKATEIERNNIVDEIREDDPDVADAIEAELEERFYEFGEPLKNMLKNFAERSETGVEMEDVERYLQSARIKNQQLANRLQLPEIREEAIAQAYNLALQMEAQIQSADMDAEAEQGELLMGYFAQNEEGQRIIKVRDIVDLENVGHEIGHMVHYELFGNPDITDFVGLLDTENLLNLLEIQVDDYNNIPDETVNLMNKMTEDLEATIKSEILKISYDVVRPMQSREAIMERYRASNSELMADYWVAYLTNHALAYDMAPKTTKMYDYALSKQENQNISNMVKTIRETLQQTSDNPDLKLQLITPEMAANLNPDKSLDLTTQAEKITAGADALIQEQKSFARLNVSDWARVIPEEMQEDIIFYIEGTDNPIKGKSFNQIKQEIESNEEALQAVREIRYNFERVRQEWNNILREADSETRINYIENYAPRIWEDNKTVVNGFYRSYNGGTTPQASQARYYPTVVEGMEAGLTPETTNILTLYKDYVDRNARPIAMNSFKNYMLDLTDENGNPIVLTEDELAELYHNNPKYSDVEIIDGREFKPEIRESVRKKRYVRTDSNILSPQGKNILVREDVYRYAREHLQKPIQKLKPISETNNLIKSLNYLFSGFHAFDLVFESGSGGLHFVKSPVTLSGNKYFDSVLPWERGMKLASYKPFLRTAIHSGLKINPMEDAFVGKLADATEKVVKWAENSPIPFAEKPLQMFETVESKWQEVMWGKLYTGSKLNSFYGVLETQKDVLPDNPTEEQIRAFYEAAADQVNQMYGGQDWSRIPIMSPQLRQVAHLAIRAPDWTLSNLKIAGRVLKPHIENFKDYGLVKPNFNEMTTDQQLEDIRRRVVARESSKYFAKMVIGVSIMMNILNFATVGRPTWENEGSIGTKFNLDVTPIVHKIQETLPFLERDEDDERRYYAMPFKQIREVFNFVQSPAQTIGYKTSPISQLAFEQIYGSQAGSGYDLGFYDDRADTLEKIGRRISRGAQTITPFTFSGTNFALTLPLRRGISEYRAILEYEDSIENKLLREDTLISDVQNQFSLARDINDIDKEVLHNGLNPLKLNETAVTNLKRKYAARLFEGITDEDTEKAEEAATALRRLRYFDISSSAEARKEDYMTEVEAIQLMANPEIVSKVQPLPLDILNPALRFEDETLTELYQDMQREVGE